MPSGPSCTNCWRAGRRPGAPQLVARGGGVQGGPPLGAGRKGSGEPACPGPGEGGEDPGGRGTQGPSAGRTGGRRQRHGPATGGPRSWGGAVAAGPLRG